jgi:N-methylhydantoinase B/oxoprolinase/acetone carboxylase alpha subunit
MGGGSSPVGEPARSAARTVAVGEDEPDFSCGAVLAHAPITRVSGYGIGVVEEGMRQIQDHAEALLRTEVRRSRDCERGWEDQIDANPDTGGPVKIRLPCRIEDDEVVYDFSDNDPAVDCAMNDHLGTTTCAAVAATKMTSPHIPINAGLRRPIRVRAGHRPRRPRTP